MRRAILFAFVLLLTGLAAQAQSTSMPEALQAGAAQGQQPDRVAKLEQEVAEAKSSGDNAWMLASSALVLMMTGPGLALFYGGLVRKKNVLGT
jgi:ammonium transporter, Amt family